MANTGLENVPSDEQLTVDPPPLDTQQVEVLGRNLLVSALVSSGLEVARPERDRGVDLIAYLDLEGDAFYAMPLQLKAATARSVSVDRKYARLPWLHIVYAWQVADASAAEFYCLAPAEVLGLATDLGWTETNSWLKDGRYTTNRPSARLLETLAPHRMLKPKHWLSKVRGTTDVRTAGQPGAAELSGNSNPAALGVGDH